MLLTSHSSRSKLVRRFTSRLPGGLGRVVGPEPDLAGYAARIDWPGVGGRPVFHEFEQFTSDPRRALRRVERSHRFWAHGPLRPLAATMAPMTWAVSTAHRRGCTSVECPTVAELSAMTGGARAWLGQRG
jgi:hypothetical protein